MAAVAAAAAIALSACGGADSSSDSSGKGASAATGKLKKIQAYVPTTMAFGAPMIGFGKKGNLSKYSDNVGVKNWDNVEQLKAAIAKNEVQIAATPAYVAANLYNKGRDVRLVAPVVWGDALRRRPVRCSRRRLEVAQGQESRDFDAG